MGQQVRQDLLRADVVRLDALQLFEGFHGRGNGHEAIKATRIVSAVVVLGVIKHKRLATAGARCLMVWPLGEKAA